MQSAKAVRISLRCPEVAAMRSAAFNVENLFERARALNLDEWVNDPEADPSRWSAGRAALDAYSKLNAILRKPVYDAADKAAIVALLKTLGLERSDESRLVVLRRNRGALVRRPRTGGGGGAKGPGE